LALITEAADSAMDHGAYGWSDIARYMFENVVRIFIRDNEIVKLKTFAGAGKP